MSSKKPVKLILGTFAIGDIAKGNGLTHFDVPKDVQALLSAFRDRGYTELDTARDYSYQALGASEDRLGLVNAPSTFTIHTKVHSGEPGAHSATNIASSITASLKALNTTGVETIFLHVPDRDTDFEETARAMNEAWKEGKFRKFGLSNYRADEVKRFVEICKRHGWVRPSVYQGHYNAIVRGGEKELVPLLREHGISFYAYSPAAGGFFSDQASSAPRWSNNTTVGQVYSSLYGQARVRASVTKVRDAAMKYGISGHAAALRWAAFHSILDGQFGDAIIFGVASMEQLKSTLDALEIGPLPEEVANAITAIYEKVEGSEPPYHWHGHLPESGR